jgi:hypothetical protein
MKTSIQPFLVNHGTARTALWRGALLWLVTLALLAGPGAASSARASAAPPDTMTYQGFLVDGNGNALAPTTPQNYPVIFRIYPVSSGAGASLWSEQQIVTVDKGSFSVLLGEGTPVGGELRPALSSVFAGATASERYISVSVTIAGTTTEILPRLRLVPSPYAFLATSASSLVQPNGSAFVSFDGGQVNVTGNLGIGTPAAGRRLQVGDVNTANSEGMIRLASRSGAGGANRAWDIGVPETDENTTGTGYSFVIDDTQRAGTEFMVQFGTGNVGIGTANPAATLDVNGNIALGNSQLLQARNNANVLENVFWPRWSDNVTYLNYGTGGFNIRNNASLTTMFMLNNGNVGIGTTAPAAPLSFGGGLANTKLALWDAGPGNMIGFGIQGSQFRLHVANPADRFSFLNGVAGTEVMTIQGSGNVGIGINSPVTQLQVKDPTSDGGRIHVGGVGANAASKLITFGDGDFVHVGEAGNDDYLELKGTRINMVGNVGIGVTGTTLPLTIQHNSDARLRLQYSNGNYADFGRNNGGVGSGGALFLQLNNNHFGAGNRAAVYDGDNNWDFSSDRRLKKDIVDAESMLDRAMQVEVRRYRWKSEGSDAKHQLGVIAQEVQPLFPDLVGEFENPNTKEKELTVGYGDFGLIAIKSLQELKREHDAELTKLKTQLVALARENAELTARNQQRDDRLAALEGLVKKLAEVNLEDKKAADAGAREQKDEAAAVAPTNASIR